VLAKREAAGEAAGFDRLRAEREALDLEADRMAASADRARAQATVASFFADVSDPSKLVAEGRATPQAPLPPVAAFIEQAESSRGELIAFRHEVAAANFAERSAERRRIPEPEIVAGTKSSTLGGGDVGSVITAHVTIPLFDRGGPERAMAVARTAQAQARAEAFRAVLRGQITALHGVVSERRSAAGQYRARAVSSADEIERIAQVSYDAGERTILDLLDAYRIGVSARVRQATLDGSLRQAEIELEFASGWEMP
jgi:outer membrane protein TolC